MTGCTGLNDSRKKDQSPRRVKPSQKVRAFCRPVVPRRIIAYCVNLHIPGLAIYWKEQKQEERGLIHG